MSAEGISANGETIPLLPENRDRIAAVIGEARARGRKAPRPPKPAGFEAALEHCQAAAALLETLFSPPKLERQLVMAASIAVCATPPPGWEFWVPRCLRGGSAFGTIRS
jgi:hypothetical protein